MISTFSIKNFRSVLELKLVFSYGEGKAPNGYQTQETLPFIETGTYRLVPCMAYFGANASGKTNLLKALEALRLLVIQGPELSEVFEPNLLNKKFQNTEFTIEFIVNGDCFEYGVTYNSQEILTESLRKNQEALFSVNSLDAEFSRQVTSESYSQEKLSDILRVECSNGEGRQIKPFLNRIGRSYRGLNKDLSNTFGFFVNSLNLLIANETVLLPVSVDMLAQTLEGDEDAALREITDFVRRLDIDIFEIDIVQREMTADEEAPPGITKINRKTGAKHALFIRTSHMDSTGKLTFLDFIKHESAGTQRLAGLVGFVLHAIKTGSVLLVDELECSLHPLLLREIVMLFKSRRRNPKGAQLIVTTHNTDILDDAILRLSEISLVRKTPANGTLVRRLIDVRNEGEDIRNVTNFRKQYLAGFYSGVPHPAL